MRIGLAYLKGSVPAFEDFGNLPTDIVKENGLIKGEPAHKILDGLIIPGGTIIESGSINPDFALEVKKISKDGFIIGICSGFQVLGKETNIGRRSPYPIKREGLGLLNVNFEPMISNDRVEASVVGESFMTKDLVGTTIQGFHCHTYGEIKGDAKPIFYSKIKRSDYKDNPREILSGVCNDDGNVVGTLIHGCLDYNPRLVENILKFLDANEKDKKKALELNNILIKKIKSELAINTKIRVPDGGRRKSKYPLMIMVASTGSGSGKTFITTGIAGALRKKGFHVGILKVGPDVRDIVPALYLVKEKMEEYSSIKIADLGWMPLKDVINRLKDSSYDIVIIEGVMSSVTGLLNEKVPYSSAEIAFAANIPVILVSNCSKGGIESAALDIVAHGKLMRKLGIDIKAVILNRVYDDEIFRKAADFIGHALDCDFIYKLPKVNISERGGTPEIEIRLEDFCLTALKTVEENINVSEIFSLAREPSFKGYIPIEVLDRKFKEGL
ncbi:MAG TPA: AAA family ATPase [Methanothermobacter sp.]|nr:cobyrinic acid a,c-diamide synthase-related protein [Methanothermobacter sp. MT-2]HHW04749.1 AAA family ATPase [Methanothermobacter sp.]HOK72239.1 AAA family ATPase [Methanothermobacter sp.]HOL68960.1 AAA family ATPase [Methanothermobacter sp.]HPQ04901.1 AAA family ATPase [Methanothermobacter sp.]